MSGTIVVNRILSVFKYIFIAFILFISLGPLIWVFMSSFKTNAEILSGYFFPQTFRFDNYITAFTTSPITRMYINSIVVSVGTTVVNLVILGMSGYAVSRFQFQFKKLIIIMISIALLIPGTALMLPIHQTISAFGMTDTRAGLILVYSGFGLAVTFYILSSYFLTVPEEMEESAYLDGAGFIRTFWSIIVPISKAGFATAAILQFLNAWNEFQFALILTRTTASRTLPMALFFFQTQYAADFGAMFAGTILIIIPSIIIFIILQKQIIEGLSAGAIKG